MALTAGQKKTAANKMKMIDAMVKFKGIVTLASAEVGVDRSTHYQWLKDDPDYKAKIDEINELILDFVESRLHSLILDLNPKAIMYYLDRRGRSRGYDPRPKQEEEDADDDEEKVIVMLPDNKRLRKVENKKKSG